MITRVVLAVHLDNANLRTREELHALKGLVRGALARAYPSFEEHGLDVQLEETFGELEPPIGTLEPPVEEEEL